MMGGSQCEVGFCSKEVYVTSGEGGMGIEKKERVVL